MFSVEDWQHGGFGVYVHWPYCLSKCPYCDFNSHVAETSDVALWTTAFLNEIDRGADLIGARSVSSIYFGGGTPSLMDPGLVAAIIDRIAARWSLSNDIEITLEANPTSIEAERFAGYRTAGVTRASVGVQALNDADLRWLGRTHTVAEARAALDIAHNTFDRVNFDLIYARRDQTPRMWQDELYFALMLASGHLSLYQLTIEPETVFGRRHAAGNFPPLPDEENAAEMYEMTQAICADAGYANYEISNYAQPGQESRHNLLYWRYGDYLGIGPGAHGRLTIDGQRHATESPRMPDIWLKSALMNSATSFSALTPSEQAEEMLLMGLRTSEGIAPERFATLNQSPLSDENIAHLMALGLIEQSHGRLRATEDGRLILNSLLPELLR